MGTTFTANEIIICITNEDGTISPIGFSQSQASMVQMVLASLSNGKPFTKSNTVFEEVKKADYMSIRITKRVSEY